MDNKLNDLQKSIEEIKASQEKVANALLGSFEKNSIGLIEESRNLRRDVDELKGHGKIHEAQITEILTFKNDAKKIVAGIAIVIPFVFELIKVGVSALWDVLSKK